MHSQNMKYTNNNIRKNCNSPARGIIAIVLVMIALAAPVLAIEEQVIQFRSLEDASTPPDPEVCAQAPFNTTVKLGASLWSYEARASDGLIKNNQVHLIGNATACTKILSLNPFTASPFYVKFTLNSGDEYVGNGQCTIINNTVPMSGIILAGCNLQIVKAPSDVLGGAATSISIFNPFKIPGFNTGSYWSLRFFKS